MSEENKSQEENQGQEVILTEAEQQAQHDQAMIDKVDSKAEATSTALQTDEEVMLAGKYKTVEELEKAYEHLQSKMGKPEESSQEDPTEVDEAPADVEEAKQIASDSGIDYTALEQEYQENGGLTEDTYKALEDAGIPEHMVDAYISGQEALAQTTINGMYNLVGGESEYGEMIQWAQDTLSESEISAFNNALTSPSSTEFAIQGLHARFAAEKGPNLIKGSSSVGSTGGFASKAEMMSQMANPQYARDPAFRAEVQRRVALSSY